MQIPSLVESPSALLFLKIREKRSNARKGKSRKCMSDIAFCSQLLYNSYFTKFL